MSGYAGANQQWEFGINLRRHDTSRIAKPNPSSL
jgi:hypothetical protein